MSDIKEITRMLKGMSNEKRIRILGYLLKSKLNNKKVKLSRIKQ